jgi:hypothetical protein
VRTAPVAAALTGAAPAVAVDGVVEINQAKAMAGGVTPGDTPGFPVTISVGGSYRLTSNLVIADSGQASPENLYGIVASLSAEPVGVDIDLNGFSLVGPMTCTPNSAGPITSCSKHLGGSGLGISGSGTLAVHDGTVQGFPLRCVSAEEQPFGARLRNLDVKWCSGGIWAYGATIENVVVRHNAIYGVTCTICTLDRVASYGNDGHGFVIESSHLEDCSAGYNDGDGIFDFGGSLVWRAVVRDNQSDGIVGTLPNAVAVGATVIHGNQKSALVNALRLGDNSCGGSVCP